MSAEDRSNLMAQCEQFVAELQSAGIRCRGDFRENYSPGWKFNHWELKVRIIYLSIFVHVFGCPSLSMCMFDYPSLSMCLVVNVSISVCRLSACPSVYQLVCSLHSPFHLRMHTQGVPLRVEIGPRDVKSCQFVAVPRVGGEKTTIANSQAVERVKGMLEQLQQFLFDR